MMSRMTSDPEELETLLEWMKRLDQIGPKLRLSLQNGRELHGNLVNIRSQNNGGKDSEWRAGAEVALKLEDGRLVRIDILDIDQAQSR